MIVCDVLTWNGSISMQFGNTVLFIILGEIIEQETPILMSNFRLNSGNSLPYIGK